MRTFAFRLVVLGAFVASLWLVLGISVLLDRAFGVSLAVWFGLIPRHVAGLDGILGMPFLHGNAEHLMANTPPLLVMGGLLAATATRALLAVNAVIVGLGGALTWLFASPAIHIGASGLVFGWLGFLIARGLVDRSPATLGAAAFVGLLYGAMLWGVLPGRAGISWEAHLFGFLAGAAAAVLIRTHVHRPRFQHVEDR